MKLEYRNKLIESFPKIFDSDFYFECDEGWCNLLFDLCSKIQSYCDEGKCEQVKATQIKEKFATLRFYHSGGDEYIYKLIDEAEAKSAETCEITGGNGILHRRGYYYKTLCKETGVLMKFNEVESKKLFQQ